jgi:hypothetical protein
MMQIELAIVDERRSQFAIFARFGREAGYGTSLNGIGGGRERTDLMDDVRLEPARVNSYDFHTEDRISRSSS